MFCKSGYPGQWIETKWRWLATQDHAKLVFKYVYERTHVFFQNSLNELLRTVNSALGFGDIIDMDIVRF